MDPSVNNLTCMNCQTVVRQADARVFAEVYVCPTCYAVAEQMYKRLEVELRRMLLMSKEAIRVALVQGKLHLPAGGLEEVSKEEVLKMIVQLSEKK